MGEGMGHGRFRMEPVDELPPDLGGSPRAKYITELQTAVEHPGQLFMVKDFKNPQGAAVVRRKLEKGIIAAPPGKWDFNSAQVIKDGKKVSELYARYLGAE